MNSSPDRLPLSPALAFVQCVWELDHALERLSGHMERSIGITELQRFVLRCVGRCPGIMAGQLAEALHLERKAVSTAVRQLDQLGLLRRRRDRSDPQRVILELTSEGRAMDVLRSGTVESAVVHLLEMSSKADIEVTRSVLRRLSEGLAEEAAVTLQRLDPGSSELRSLLRS